MSTPTREPQEWAENGFLEEFSRMDCTMPDRQFCFFLGSGASVSSGIPAGGKLAYEWLNDIYRLKHGQDVENDEVLKSWATDENLDIENFEFDRAAEFYSLLYERRFQHDPKSAYPYLEDLMDGKEPRFGYSVLAQLLTRKKTPHKVVITTNFDNLVSDALAFYTQTAPLVCGHESLAGFAGTRLRRPLIAKIHGDLFLNPRNAEDEINQLHESWQKSLRSMFRQYTPIFLGYGGNDPSVMNFLAKIDPGEIEGGVYWVYRRGNPPPQAARDLVVKHGGALVASTGFDEFMFLLHQKLKLPYLADEVKKHAEQRARHYQNHVDALVKSVSQSPANEQQSEKAAVRRITDAPESWWQWEIKAKAESDPDQQERIYRQAIEALPDSHELLGNFAIFLTDIRGQHDEAEKLYREAIEIEPEHANNLGNFANFLKNIRGQHDEAEELYRKAIEIEPEHAGNLGNFATFLTDIRGQHDEAEELYRKAIEIEPEHANNLGNFAIFLTSIRGQHDEAEKLYRKAIEIEPENANKLGNFAVFLKNIRGQYDEAEKLYRKAIEIEPDNAALLTNFATFLTDIRGQHDEAEKLYREAIEIEPEHANNLGNFANFLKNIRGQHDEAEELHRKAIKIEPEHASHLGNFANFLKNIRGQYDEAEEFYRKAIEIEPENAGHLGNFATFLTDIRGQHDEAEELYREAIEIEPENADNLGNFAIFLTDIRGQHDEAEKLFRKAIEIEPEHANNLCNFAGFLLARQRWEEAEAAAAEAWGAAAPKQSQVAGEVLMYRLMLSEVLGQDQNEALGRLKTLFGEALDRGVWSFDPMFDAITDKIDADDLAFYRAVADGVLDEEKAKALEETPRWREIEPIPLDAPWPEK